MNEFLFLENDGSWQEGIVSGNKNFLNLLSHHRFYFHKKLFKDSETCFGVKKNIPYVLLQMNEISFKAFL